MLTILLNGLDRDMVVELDAGRSPLPPVDLRHTVVDVHDGRSMEAFVAVAGFRLVCSDCSKTNRTEDRKVDRLKISFVETPHFRVIAVGTRYPAYFFNLSTTDAEIVVRGDGSSQSPHPEAEGELSGVPYLALTVTGLTSRNQRET